MSKKGRKAMAVVKFENVSRVYKSGDHELKALDSVNMELEEGRGKEHAFKSARRT